MLQVAWMTRQLTYRHRPMTALDVQLVFLLLNSHSSSDLCELLCFNHGLTLHFSGNFGESVALLVARRINNRKVVGSKPAKVVCNVYHSVDR